jgi:hypothetical protein
MLTYADGCRGRNSWEVVQALQLLPKLLRLNRKRIPTLLGRRKRKKPMAMEMARRRRRRKRRRQPK